MTANNKDLNPIVCFQFTSNSIQIAASLEIIDSFIKVQNRPVYYYWLGGGTRYPSTMARGLDGPLRTVKFFPRFLKKALSSINSIELQTNSKIKKRSDFNLIRKELLKQCENFVAVQEFSTLCIGEISPGGAIANSFVYETGKRTIDYSKDKRLLKLLLTSYLETYFGVMNVLKERQPFRVVLYNGRFLHERATWDACKQIGVEVSLFETTRNRFHVRLNQGFHDRILNQRLMKDFWYEKERQLDSSLILDLGSKYFRDLESSRNRFYSGSSLDNEIERYFVFFSNSDDEAIGFWDSWTEPFLEQVELVQNLQIYFRNKLCSHLYIRLHPNLSNKSKDEQARWFGLVSENTSTVIGAKEKVSSYQLLKGALGVISFGSTIGLEAAYHKIPSAILADCWYDELGVADKLNSFEELTQWIDTVSECFPSQKLIERKNGALVRGLWMELAGNSFLYSEMRELAWGSWEVTRFKDVKISRNKLRIAISVFSNKMKRRSLGLRR